MQKVTFDTEELKKVLAKLGAVVAKKANVPVLGHVRLFSQQQEGTLGFSVAMIGADIDATIQRAFVKAEVEEEVDVLLPFTKLVDVTANVSAKTCEIIIDGETKATFKAGKYSAALKPHPLANWPASMEWPEAAKATIALPGLRSQIEQVDFAVPAADGKFIVAVAKVEYRKDSLALIGTDGKVLAISKVPQDVQTEFDLTIPKPALELVKKLDGPQVTLYESEAGFIFQTELEILTITRSHGTFPPYENILPKSHSTQVVVRKKEFLEAIKRVKPLADPEKPVIVFAPKGTTLGLWAAHVESGSDGSSFRNMASDEIDTAKDAAGQPQPVVGNEVELSLDSALLLPFVEKAFGSDDGDIVLQATEANKAVEFYANGGTYRFLQMPCAAPSRS